MIQSETISAKKKHIAEYLKWNLKKENSFDLPCYNRPDVQEEFRKKIQKICDQQRSSNDNTEIVKILAPLTDNPHAPDNIGRTPIHRAADKGHTEIVKILAPLTENPNAPDEDGETPIYWAAQNGHTEIVKILAPLTDNTNVSDT